MKNLVVVESPTKAKTIKKYLGKEFEVLASSGHVRDLLPKDGAVEPDNGFAMHYQLLEKNVKFVNAITKAMQQAETLYLATDPDREGEAISWHLYEILKENNSLQSQPVRRVVFHEITQHAIQEAVAHPRQLSMDLVNAQQARRALDYLVGFTLSPLLWKKIRYGLSAGRVQSPALRLIVEREQEIESFKPREYWTIVAECQKARQSFVAKLNWFEGKKLKQFDSDISDTERATCTCISTEAQATYAKTTLLKLAEGQLQIIKVEKKQRKRQPAAPFTTSTLQQEAARKLGFTTKKTMQLAQQLYEGIDTGNGAVGIITYMRTDSVNLAEEAVAEIRQVIQERYGDSNVPKQPRLYKTKSKNAQEAHEAIRPTSAKRYPDTIKDHLTPDQARLYNLIWQRTVACQMIDATLDTVAVDLVCGKGNNFRATGSSLSDPGFMAVYQEGIDDPKNGEDDDKMLPVMVEGEWVKLKDILADQHFTEPPPRFSEATLVKALEEFGIGRPSTYATIISTLQQREYVILEKKRFIPTDVGRIVNKFLTAHFTQYVDYDFTAKLEDELDAVSRGEQEWVPLLARFWTTFKQLIDEKTKTVSRKDMTNEVIDEICPNCGKQLVIQLGKRGRFIGCSAYPKCKYTRNMESDTNGTTANNGTDQPATTTTPEVVPDRVCPDCGAPLHIRQGPYSKFIGCSKYPKCKFNESLEKPMDTGQKCPICQQGNLIRKKTRYGTFFYACSNYPTCKYAVSNEPIMGPCPQCGWSILTLKTTKRWGTEKVCPQKECDYRAPVATEETGTT